MPHHRQGHKYWGYPFDFIHIETPFKRETGPASQARPGLGSTGRLNRAAEQGRDFANQRETQAEPPNDGNEGHKGIHHIECIPKNTVDVDGQARQLKQQREKHNFHDKTSCGLQMWTDKTN
jgi:hypothetical protein